MNSVVELEHIQVAPRGQPGGYIDDVLREKGLARTVARAVPYFLTALQLVLEGETLVVRLPVDTPPAGP